MKEGKKEGCFKEHWKVVVWVVVMVAAITVIVVDVVLNWNAVATTFVLSTCIGDQFITPFSRKIVVSDTKKCWFRVFPIYLDLTRYKYVESIEIGDNCFPRSRLNLNGLNRLKSIRIGDDNFKRGGDFYIMGLKKLESVVIGKNSIRKDLGAFYFYLKDCPTLRELKIGRKSVYGCHWVIENLPSLEVIEIEQKEARDVYGPSLELRSD